MYQIVIIPTSTVQTNEYSNMCVRYFLIKIFKENFVYKNIEKICEFKNKNCKCISNNLIQILRIQTVLNKIKHGWICHLLTNHKVWNKNYGPAMNSRKMYTVLYKKMTLYSSLAWICIRNKCTLRIYIYVYKLYHEDVIKISLVRCSLHRKSCL